MATDDRMTDEEVAHLRRSAAMAPLTQQACMALIDELLLDWSPTPQADHREFSLRDPDATSS